jgi:AcrR family transcriptional regulator
LRATLQLLDEHGYRGLRVDDVAQRAGVGLGAVYRRWSTKQQLVVAALQSLADEQRPPRPSEDPVTDVLDGLHAIACALTGPRARLLRSLLAADDEPELAAAVRDAKIEPLLAEHRARVRRATGATGPTLDARADAGPALIVFEALVRGRAMSRMRIERDVLPIVLGADTATGTTIEP